MVSKSKTEKMEVILNQGAHYATHYDFVIACDPQPSKTDSVSTSQHKPDRVYYVIETKKTERKRESLKQAVERGFDLIIESVPDVFDLNPKSHIAKIDAGNFQSQATLDHAWHRTGDQLRSSLNAFRLTYDNRTGAESKRRG